MSGIQVVIEGDLQTLDLTQPDNIKVVWPVPRDAKRDVATYLKNMLSQHGLERIHVVAEGSFKQSMLRDADDQQRPVITITRTGDSAERISVGRLLQFAAYDSVAQNFVEVTGTVLQTLAKSGEPIEAKGSVSHETLELSIYDENQQRADQMYLYVKTAMEAAYDGFAALNYLELIRTNGDDEPPVVLTFEGGTRIVFQRTLTYSAQHFDFLEGISSLVTLIQSTFTGQSVDSTGNSAESVDLAP